MAGRRAHISSEDGFNAFVESIPEDARSHGYWRVKRESSSSNGGGVIQSFIGFIPVEFGETYDSLRNRIMESFGEKYGCGTYYAIACNDRKAEIKNLDLARFEFNEKELPMIPTGSAGSSNPSGDDVLRETINTAKKMHRDVAEIESMKMRQDMLNQLMGKKKEEEPVKENASGGMNELMMMKFLMGDGMGGPKKETVDPAIYELKAQLAALAAQPKVDPAVAELKAMVMAMNAQPKVDPAMEALKDAVKDLVRAQAAPKEDSETKLLLKHFVEKDAHGKQENAVTAMMALMVKQQEEERRVRQDEDKRREEDRKDRERTREADERRREDDRKVERDRLDRERKDEQKRSEETAKLEREKFERELTERTRRFDEELKLRREEMRHDENSAKIQAVEQQKMQFELIGLFKNNKDSSLDSTAKIVEAMTAAGMGSMKTAQEAASTIMQIAKNSAPKEKEEKGGFAESLKDLGAIAAPFIAPYIDADAKLKMIEAASRMGGRGQGQQQRRPQQQQPQGQQQPPQGQQTQQQPQAQTAPAAGGEGLSGAATEGPSTDTNELEGQNMIAQLLKQQPELKDALVGSLKDKQEVEMFADAVLDFCDQSGLAKAVSSMVALMDQKRMMSYVKLALSPEEQKLVDENEPWFIELRKKMKLEYTRIKAEEKEDEAEEVAEAAAVKQPPVKQ
jgi:hypothetical protein